MGKYFDLDEFLSSDTALVKKIPNYPSWEIVDNLREFSEILDSIRCAYSHPIYISSGYRSDGLNKAVGGAYNSGHKYGWTADLLVDGNLRQFADFVKDYLITNEIKWDELLFEKSGKTEWVHFAWKGKDGQQRMKCFDIIK